MRSHLAMVLTLLLAHESAGKEPAILLDPAKQESRRRAELEWNRKTLGGAYDKVGKKGPKWDGPARQALELFARYLSNERDDVRDDAFQAAKAAIDAGCDDPMVLFVYAQTSIDGNFPGEAEANLRGKAATRALAASKYPAFRRAAAWNRDLLAAQAVPAATEASRKEVQADIDAILGLLPPSIAEDERNEHWEGDWAEIFAEVTRGYRHLGVEPTAAHRKVNDALAKHPKVATLRLRVRANFWYRYGWEARGTSFADKVPDGGLDKFEARLVESQKALRESWRIRPDDLRVAYMLMQIELGIGGDRRAIDLWFDRAMRAGGGTAGPCSTMLTRLSPKWGGSADEALAFARACRATKDWREGITLLGDQCYTDALSTLVPADRGKFLGSPEVWGDIRSIYDDYLGHYPNDHLTRSRYAAFAAFAGRQTEAHAQFEKLGDHITPVTGNLKFSLERMKQLRATAAEADARTRAATGPGARPKAPPRP